MTESADAKLDALFYAQMVPSEKGEPLKWKSTSTVELDEGTAGLFVSYFKEVKRWTRSDSYTAYESLPPDNTGTVRRVLDQICSLKIPTHYNAFNDACKTLADRLREAMDMRSRVGVLFIGRFVTDESTSICLLKLDPEEHAFCQFLMQANQLRFSKVESALPGPNRLHKGAVYPHPDDPQGYLKIVQTAPASDYFNRFLEATPLMPSYKIAKAMGDAYKSITGKTPSIEVEGKLFDQLRKRATEQGSRIELTDLKEIARTLAPDASEEKLDQALSVAKVSPGILQEDDVQALKLECRLDDITVYGPYESMLKSVHHRTEGQTHVLTIRGKTFEAGTRRR